MLELDLPANELAFNTQTGMLYATVPSAAGIQYGNRIVEISPTDAHVTRSVFLGSEPGPIGMSPDAPLAYVGLNGAAEVYPLDLWSLMPGTPFSFGFDSFQGPLFAGSIAVMAGSPGTAVISLRNRNVDPHSDGVAVYDSGVARPLVDHATYGSTQIAFGTRSDVLYGFDDADTSYTLNRLTIGASGISTTASAMDLITNFKVKIVVEGDTIFASSGVAIDGTRLQVVGTYALPGNVVAGTVTTDAASASVIFASGNQVLVYDRDTYLRTGTINVPSGAGKPVSAASCGDGCLAVAYDSNRILVLHDVADEIFLGGFE